LLPCATNLFPEGDHPLSPFDDFSLPICECQVWFTSRPQFASCLLDTRGRRVLAFDSREGEMTQRRASDHMDVPDLSLLARIGCRKEQIYSPFRQGADKNATLMSIHVYD